MYVLSTLVRVTIPNYLAGLPIPDSFGGWFKLGGKNFIPINLDLIPYINFFPVANNWASELFASNALTFFHTAFWID